MFLPLSLSGRRDHRASYLLILFSWDSDEWSVFRLSFARSFTPFFTCDKELSTGLRKTLGELLSILMDFPRPAFMILVTAGLCGNSSSAYFSETRYMLFTFPSNLLPPPPLQPQHCPRSTLSVGETGCFCRGRGRLQSVQSRNLLVVDNNLWRVEKNMNVFRLDSLSQIFRTSLLFEAVCICEHQFLFILHCCLGCLLCSCWAGWLEHKLEVSHI